MTQNNFSCITDGFMFYFYDKKNLNIDDFIKLEYIAAVQKELMNHQIFFVFELDINIKIYTSLN